MANMIEKFKENKKVMEIKMEQASKMADAAADEFVKTLEPLVKDASREDIEKFLECEDEMIPNMYKMAVLAKFAEVNDAGGIMILGVRK